jgi:hypothetical protein
MAATHFSGPIVVGSGNDEVVAAATTLTAKDNGKTFFLDAAAGATITLPSGAVGMRFKFIVTSAFATSNWVVDSAEGDNISGNLIVAGAHVAAAAEDQINFVATAESVGDWIELVWDNTNSQWIVFGVAGLTGGITATDPS